ncbi:HU family DNA-binding protein [Burkholderia dolosa]|uniref:HU family DNA-binding protein n=1 Tax=Burkholderia dolosa TaxID=152500 RepID=UPI001B8F16F3|nr:HU family DNA-binding protein [Burkholderia dolosa]MBR8314674.1 HU family DNA-binding protein [Burkholderia dolosa]
MNKDQLIAVLAERIGLSQAETEQVLDQLGDIVTIALVGNGYVRLPRIGKLAVKHYAPRKGYNPSSGESIAIPARRSATFSAAKALRDALTI